MWLPTNHFSVSTFCDYYSQDLDPDVYKVVKSKTYTGDTLNYRWVVVCKCLLFLKNETVRIEMGAVWWLKKESKVTT